MRYAPISDPPVLSAAGWHKTFRHRDRTPPVLKNRGRAKASTDDPGSAPSLLVPITSAAIKDSRRSRSCQGSRTRESRFPGMPERNFCASIRPMPLMRLGPNRWTQAVAAVLGRRTPTPLIPLQQVSSAPTGRVTPREVIGHEHRSATNPTPRWVAARDDPSYGNLAPKPPGGNPVHESLFSAASVMGT